jgi:hypothetical protein
VAGLVERVGDALEPKPALGVAVEDRSDDRHLVTLWRQGARSWVALVTATRSVRSAGRAVVVAAGALSLAVWMVPMSVEQPGGLAAIRRAGAAQWASVAQRTSLAYHARRAAALNNAGQVAGYTLAAVQLLAALGVVLWAVRLGQRERGPTGSGRLFRLTSARLPTPTCRRTDEPPPSTPPQ